MAYTKRNLCSTRCRQRKISRNGPPRRRLNGRQDKSILNVILIRTAAHFCKIEIVLDRSNSTKDRSLATVEWSSGNVDFWMGFRYSLIKSILRFQHRNVAKRSRRVFEYRFGHATVAPASRYTGYAVFTTGASCRSSGVVCDASITAQT